VTRCYEKRITKSRSQPPIGSLGRFTTEEFSVNPQSFFDGNLATEMALNGDDDLNRPLRDFIIPKATNMRPSVVAPVIAANNFELKANLIAMAQHNQFVGLPNDDPHLYLAVFLEIYDTYKSNVSDDALRLRLFSFSLRDRARAWMHSLPAGSITTWDQFDQVFSTK
jgi:peptidoglycan hydrolase-like protein with peptidoglycan-binding domain